MSSLSRILYRTFCTSLSTTKPTSPSIRTLIADLFAERNLNVLVEKFKKSSENYHFRRRKHRIYEVTVRRLASAKRFTSIVEILEDQKKYKDILNEDFAIRLITLYGESGMFYHAYKTFDQLPELKCARTVKSFNVLLNVCVDSKNYDKVEVLFREFQSKNSITPDTYSYNIVIRGFCEMGSLDSALSMLEEMEKNGVSPNLITFNIILNAFYGNGRFSDGEKIWDRMEKSDIFPDIRTFNAKLKGLIHEKKIEEAVKFVEELKNGELVKPDVFSYNALINGFCDNGNSEEAKKIFSELVQNDCTPNRQTYVILISHLCETGDFDLALKLCNDSMCRRCFVSIKLLQKVVDGLVKHSKVKELVSLLEEMEKNGVSPNLITFNMILNAFYENGRFSDGEKIWDRMEKSDIVPDIRSFNAKLKGLIHGKKIEEAVKLVEELKNGELVKPDVFSYNALINGFCDNGNSEEAKKIFSELVQNDCTPNRQTYEILISHLCETGEFDLAFKLCNHSITMSRRCFVSVELLQKVVDGLVKQSKVKEAEKLVELAKSNRYYGTSSLQVSTDVE